MGRARPGEREPSSPGPAAPPASPPRRARARALALLGALLAAAAAAAAARAFARHAEAQAAARQDSALKALGTEGLFLFSSLDTDGDTYLSPEEFKPIAEKLTGSTPSASYEEEDLPPDPSEETLTIEARFQPLLPESMTKSKDGFLGVSRLALSGLRNWTTAASPSAVFAARHFRPFLPPRGHAELGEPWWIIPSELNVFTGYLSNNRFYPPPPKGKEVIIHRLLSMFHPRPFVKTRFAPQGAVACLTATSDFYYTVMFRIHAEFQLSEPPDFPFWFSPGQFTGHIILSKDATHVRDFRLFVPNHRSLNVDMEWLYGASEGSNMEVDIGYIPQMELEATGPSVPSVILDEDGNMIDSRLPSGEPLQFVFEEITWQQELNWEEAARRLEVAMYPFKKVTYLPFTEAFEQAKAENKLVHSVLLWGALDDQSCHCSGRTLRETVLESSPILALLNESFISTWSLVKELEDLQNNQENPSHKKLASLHLEKYSFPVEMMICLPNGTVVHHINANYFLDITSVKPEDIENNVFSFSSTFEDPSTATYMQFLKEGLRRGLPLLQA
uniref:Selenoprotein N n=1 Tax=Balaenoptera musculus TaxID=9771 RepID=A0A8C0HW31_BALMU